MLQTNEQSKCTEATSIEMLIYALPEEKTQNKCQKVGQRSHKSNAKVSVNFNPRNKNYKQVPNGNLKLADIKLI